MSVLLPHTNGLNLYHDPQVYVILAYTIPDGYVYTHWWVGTVDLRRSGSEIYLDGIPFHDIMFRCITFVDTSRARDNIMTINVVDM